MRPQTLESVKQCFLNGQEGFLLRSDLDLINPIRFAPYFLMLIYDLISS
jgi:hypothetical protein